MCKASLWTGFCVIGVLSVSWMTFAAEEEPEEAKLALSDCPPAVQKTFKREANGAPIANIIKESDESGVAFVLDVKNDGRTYEIRVSEDGTLLLKEWDEDDGVDVKLADCPSAVKKTLKKESAGAKIETAEKGTEYGIVVFTADAKIDGKNYEIKVTTEGVLLSKVLDEEEPAETMKKEDGDEPAAEAKQGK